MQKSFIERVFPKSTKAVLPQYNVSSSYHDHPRRSQPEHTRSTSNASDSRSSARSQDADTVLGPAPMTASIMHHNDPFIAVDRAAQNLQRTIQSLLDFQSESLSGRNRDDADTSSQRSVTPTQSTTRGSLRGSAVPGTTPKRQPVQKRPTLRAARRGIGRAMHEFAVLKEEELRITQDERTHRKTALDKVAYLEAKRESVQHEITNLEANASENDSQRLREEAREVQNEIHELEGRLMELKAKHRHLSNRAEEIENVAASDLSSYKGALALVDKEVRSFLRHPPVKQGLGPRNSQRDQDMYILRPERRSLGLAKEQWTSELEVLEQHGSETGRERDALLEGAKMWQEVVRRIDEFEETLRSRMRTRVSEKNSVSEIVGLLDGAMHFLEECLNQAEARDWKLLICAIGPELESFRQARLLLAPGEALPITKPQVRDSMYISTNGASGSHNRSSEDEDADVPHADLLGIGEEEPSDSHTQPTSDHHSTSRDIHNFPVTTSSDASNESLKATLRNLPSEANARQPASFGSASMDKSPQRQDTRYSESEDDDPGPDFLLSR